jgi:catecholate siderophore receptor
MPQSPACREKPATVFVVSLISLGLSSAALAEGNAPAGQAAGDGVVIGTVEVEASGPEGFSILPAKTKGYRAERTGTATKTDTDLINVPQSVTVVTGDQIKDRAVTSMSEAVRYVPGATFAQGEGNRDTAVLRGVSSTADFFLDGVRDDVEYYRDLYNIDRIEVLKGPNAMVFGRGATGGLINRVTRQANWDRVRELRVGLGMFDQYRATIDAGQAVGDAAAIRLTGLYENADSFRDGVTLERWGVNPTASFLLGPDTLLTFGVERFEDERTADRGIPSTRGGTLADPAGPVPGIDRSTFFGDPGDSPVHAYVDAISLGLEHRFENGIILRNKLRYADYDKKYQNVFPGSLNAANVVIGSTVFAPDTAVSISAYNNTQLRQNFINTTDLTAYFDIGSVRHTLLAGLEYGQQRTENLRLTGFFSDFGNATSIFVPLANPNVDVNLTWAPNATDASNEGTTEFAAIYLQDQIELSPVLQLVAGLRYDNFRVDFLNRRTNVRTETRDDLWSPRVGLIYKPAEDLSLYASYSVSYLPRSGAQLASLTPTNAAFEPEEFINTEIGAKWLIRPELQLDVALFQLERSNIIVTDPNNPAQSILLDGQETRGLEISLSGDVTESWSVIASYGYLDTEVITSATAAPTEAANAPNHTLGLWNKVSLTPDFAAAVGVIYQSARFAGTDNTVKLPGFTRVDLALFYDVSDALALQLNVENLFDETYFPNAHSNTNITPGAPLTVKLGLTANF